jgi:hypothetical protein
VDAQREAVAVQDVEHVEDVLVAARRREPPDCEGSLDAPPACRQTNV